MLEKIQNKRIQERLASSSFFTLILASAASLLAIIAIIIVMTKYDDTLTYYGFSQGDIGLAMNEFAEVRSATRAIIGYDSEEAISFAMAQHDTSVKETEEFLDIVEETAVTDEGKEILSRTRKELAEYYEIEAKVLELGSTPDPELSAQAQAMAIDELNPAYDECDKTFTEMLNMKVEKGDNDQDFLTVLSIVLIVLAIALTIIAFLIAMKISTTTAKGIVNPMKQLITRLESFAQGDISSPFPEYKKDDEIADMVTAVSNTTKKIRNIIDDLNQYLGEMAEGNFDVYSKCEQEYVGEFKGLLDATNAMNEELNITLSDVKDASDMVNAGAVNLAEASQSLAEGATDQAASVEELQAMISEIATVLTKTATEVDEAYDNAKSCAQEAEKSHEEMNVMVEAMNKISETSQKIGNIIAEIEDIASQTNLLSLNAAIEAARAGDAGKGFAVVADQIRNLADQSAKSAVNTKQLIEEAISEIQIGNTAAAQTSEVLIAVVESIHKIAETSKQLSEITAKEAASIEQADQGIAQISEVVQSNSATAEETSATSEELSAQATSMDEMIGKFNIKK